MASRSRRWPVVGSLAVAIVASVLVTQGAHATPPQGDAVVNSPKGFIGCLSDGAFSQRKFSIYCLAAQVPSVGAEVTQLTTDTWTCRYTNMSTTLSTSHIVLPQSDLKVRRDGSFRFAARLPLIGRVSIVAAGGAHAAAAEPTTRVIGPTGYRPQGYTLVSPTIALTNYSLDPTATLGPNALNSGPAPGLISASVHGHLQDELIGSVWRGPTSGEWDFDTC